MTIRKIIEYPHPILSSIAEPITPRDDKKEIAELLYDMAETCISNKGVGLAAPQVGVNKRVIVILSKNKVFCLINPIITKNYGGKHWSREGCLSVPNKQIRIQRWGKVEVSAYNELFNLVNLKLKGIDARIVQHEIDHLDGICIVKEKQKEEINDDCL